MEELFEVKDKCIVITGGAGVLCGCMSAKLARRGAKIWPKPSPVRFPLEMVVIAPNQAYNKAERDVIFPAKGPKNTFSHLVTARPGTWKSHRQRACKKWEATPKDKRIFR